MSFYSRLVGPTWRDLPRSIRDLYGADAPTSARGSFKIERGRSVLARFVATLAGLPKSGDAVPTEVRVTPGTDGARWERRFGDATLATDQHERGGLMVERTGPLEYGFALRVEDGALVFDQRRVAIALGPLRVPLPRWLHGRVTGRAYEDDRGAVCTDVSIAIPILGTLVRYAGVFDPEIAARAAAALPKQDRG